MSSELKAFFDSYLYYISKKSGIKEKIRLHIVANYFLGLSLMYYHSDLSYVGDRRERPKPNPIESPEKDCSR